MPIYEYVCNDCGHQLEARQKLSDAALTDCPSCRHASLERLVSASSFALKGSGWYADGYGEAKKPPKTAATSESKKGTKDKSADTSKTSSETAPSSKPDKKKSAES